MRQGAKSRSAIARAFYFDRAELQVERGISHLTGLPGTSAVSMIELNMVLQMVSWSARGWLTGGRIAVAERMEGSLSRLGSIETR